MSTSNARVLCIHCKHKIRRHKGFPIWIHHDDGLVTCMALWAGEGTPHATPHSSQERT